MDELQEYPDVAVLIPCRNEAVTIAKVVTDFRRVLPGAGIFVFDNASDDETSNRARDAGATVHYSPRRGKGNVVRHMFSMVEARWFILVDGDDTYPPDAAPELLSLARNSGAEMVVGIRMHEFSEGAFRALHEFGNRMLARVISSIFRTPLTDILSGYRVFSRSFVRTIPLTSQGFEIETELTLRAIARNYAIEEMPIYYGKRPPGSVSKLNTFSDGFRIIKLLLIIFRDYKPLTFFGSIGLVFFGFSILAGFPAMLDFYRHSEVYHLPLAVLAAALAVIGCLFAAVGTLLHSIRNYHAENFELFRKILQP